MTVSAGRPLKKWAVVLALLIIDPTRDLTVVFILLALGVGLMVAARRMREREDA